MKNFLKDIDPSWTLFLDRDGVINRRLVDDYIKHWGEFEFLPGVLDSISLFSKLFGRIIIVTNQQGVGKGWMTEDQLKEIHGKMIDTIEQAGGKVDAIYYCTDLKDTPDNCRKPAVAMFEKAKKDFPEIVSEKSIMVGDSRSDMEFGKNAGMITVFIGGENNSANVCFEDLKSFASAIS
jgi:D-glycero-D-manno-heptose 1,7-bisphosphate phosphatase